MARAGIYETAPLPPAVFPGQGEHVASQRPRLRSPPRAQVRRPGLAPGGKEKRREGGAEAGEHCGAGAVYTRGGGATLPTGEAAWPGGRRRSLGRLFGSRLEEGAVAPRPRNLAAAPGLREAPPRCSWGFPSPGSFPPVELGHWAPVTRPGCHQLQLATRMPLVRSSGPGQPQD